MNNSIEEELIKKLENNEEILYKGEAHVSKTSMQLFRFLIAIIALIIFWYLCLKIPSGTNMLMKTIFMLLLTFLSLILIYGLLYNLFFKYKNKNNRYYVTNKNIIKYNLRKGFIIRKIDSINLISIGRIKDNYADLNFSFTSENLIEKMKTTLTFEGVENYKEIIDIILKYNNSIMITDDRITIMGKKI